MWVFLVTEVLFFGGLFTGLPRLPPLVSGGLRRGSHELLVWAGTLNTVVLITSSLTMALAVHAAQTGERRLLMLLLARDDAARAACSSASRRSSTTPSSWSTTCPGSGFQFEARASRARADLLLALLRDDRAARAAHDHRPRHHVGDAVVVVPRRSSRRSTTTRSRSAASTGTSSTSSGSSCSRCCI